MKSNAAVGTEALARIVSDFDKYLPVYNVRPLEWHIASRGGPLRFYANTLVFFSGIALLLAAMGIYGLISYSVTDRFH